MRAALQSLPAHEINTTIDANKGTRPHIPNQAVILNWEVATVPGGCNSCGGLHFDGSLWTRDWTVVCSEKLKVTQSCKV
jgi:hypothetical protein